MSKMKVVAVNIGKKETVKWKGKTIQTGIYKYPVDRPIVLEETDVAGDIVCDRKHHGGIDKACYIYSADHYASWKEKYPDLEWSFGMFGENITVEGLDEKQILIGDIFYLGNCRVQVTQPRQPCNILGIRFNSQEVIKDFIGLPFPGIYVKIIEGGEVKTGDSMQLSERLHDSIGLLEVWELLYNRDVDFVNNKDTQDLMSFALNFQHLAQACKNSLRKRAKYFFSY